MKNKLTVLIEGALKKALSPKTWIQSIKSKLTLKNIIITIVDALVAFLVLFTFWGDILIGQNLPIDYLLIVVFFYLTYVIYKGICHIQDLFEAGKNNEKKKK